MVIVASAAIFAAVLPFAQVQLGAVWGFIPVYESAVVINDLVTAALLIGQFSMLRSSALLVLSFGYFFTASMAVAHMLSFPGLFSTTGLLGAGPQTTAWLYMFWHGGFSLAVIGFAALPEKGPTPYLQKPRVGGPALVLVGFAFLLACGLTALASAGHDLLPEIMQGNTYTSGMLKTVSIVWALNLLAVAVLWQHRRRSLLHLLCMVVSVACVFDMALSAVFNHGRFDVGFYVGRAYGLLASGFVLVVLIIENGKLYARVVEALDGERRERQHVQDKTRQLNEANERLEQRVVDRTAQLTATNKELRQEIVDRKRVERALERAREELSEMASVSATAREEEKRRIARELHDELAQSLAALKVDMQLFEHQLAGGSKSLAQRVALMERTLDDAIAATRRIASDLRPPMLDDLGLVPACRWLIQSFQRRYGIQCELTIVPSQFELAEPYATTVYRAMQECLANVARHAQASLVHVRLSYCAPELVLSVRDNGVGFDQASAGRSDSFGLIGLRERAYLVQGRLRIESSPGAGTLVELTIPETTASGQRHAPTSQLDVRAHSV
nr:sensor histidine kinase [Ralstonia sp. UBA689]